MTIDIINLGSGRIVAIIPVNKVSNSCVGLGDLAVKCLPRDPRFAGSNLAEVDGFFQDVIS